MNSIQHKQKARSWNKTKEKTIQLRHLIFVKLDDIYHGSKYRRLRFITSYANQISDSFMINLNLSMSIKTIIYILF